MRFKKKNTTSSLFPSMILTTLHVNKNICSGKCFYKFRLPTEFEFFRIINLTMGLH